MFRCHCAVTDALVNNACIRDISGALSILALVQYLHLRECLVDVQLDHATANKTLWRWTSSGMYSSSSAYATFFHGQIVLGSTKEVWRTVLGGTKEVWRTKAPHEHKFFLWLAIQDRCWTSERRCHHGLMDSDDCMLCGQSVETMDHLLVGYVFSKEHWYKFLHHIGSGRILSSSLLI
jgi:hypothetical protein